MGKYHELTDAELQMLRTESTRVTIQVENVVSGYQAELTLFADPASDNSPRALAAIPARVLDYESPSRRPIQRVGPLDVGLETWRAPTEVLRPGDGIAVVALVSAGNGYLKQVGLHADRVCLRVSRPGTPSFNLPLAERITPDNFARAVRRAPGPRRSTEAGAAESSHMSNASKPRETAYKGDVPFEGSATDPPSGSILLEVTSP